MLNIQTLYKLKIQHLKIILDNLRQTLLILNTYPINFIEHLSFSPFNESTRLVNSVWYSRTLFGKITQLSADDIYATNANLTQCSSQNITTNFKRKGRAGKHEDHRQIMAMELRKERATRMEGSFGTEKQQSAWTRSKPEQN